MWIHPFNHQPTCRGWPWSGPQMQRGAGRTLRPTALRRGTGCHEEAQGGHLPSPRRMRKAPEEGGQLGLGG